MSVKVTNEVPTYDEPATPSVRVHSHWNEPSKVVLEVKGEKATVGVAEIEAAIRNASNTARHS
jgi:hypothetical protein